MSGAADGATRVADQEERAAALERLAAWVRPFPLERRLEDEPADHGKALERLAAAEPER